MKEKIKTLATMKAMGSSLYYELRSLGLSHSMALASVIEAVLEELNVKSFEGFPAFEVPPQAVQKKRRGRPRKK